MNSMFQRLGAGAVLLFLLALPALASPGGANHQVLHWMELILAGAPLIGAVSVNYFIRGGPVLINGSATPPTAVQASQVQKQTAQIIMLDADVQALFTHNWGLDASAPTYFEPEILGIVNQGPAQPAGTWLPNFSADWTNTNAVKLNKLNFLGSGGTFMVTLRRPHSVGQ